MTILRTLLFLSCTFTLIGCPSAPEEDPVKIEGDDAGECSDEADNDNDGLFDCDDEGCKGSPACKEEPATEGSGDGNTDGAIEDAGSSDGRVKAMAKATLMAQPKTPEAAMVRVKAMAKATPMAQLKMPEAAMARVRAMAKATPMAQLKMSAAMAR